MKVVHISTSDLIGGASIATNRLNKALIEEGIDSKIIVLNKGSDEQCIESVTKTRLKKNISNKLINILNDFTLKKYKNREKIIFSPAYFGTDISKNNYILEADIVHFHWVVGGFLSLNSIKNIFKLNKKIIWTLHDSWLFTGGCHIRYGCNRYKEFCGRCPILSSDDENDISKKVIKKKLKIFNKVKDLEIITPSKWMYKCAKESNLLKKNRINIIPNILNERIFKSINKNIAKEILDLDLEKKYICFGAFEAVTTKYKGFSYLVESLNIIKNNFPEETIEILVFGASHSRGMELPYKVKFMGEIKDEYTMALIYNASEVFIASSIEDNLPNTVLESLNCGTPVVGFNTGGIPDMIAHKINGYLAKEKNSFDLAEGILWSMKNLKKVSLNYDEFSKKIVLKKMISLYEKNSL